jgi:hypothetical protein
MGIRFVAASCVLFAAAIARGDGGALIAEGPAGPFEISVLASPAPLRAGTSEWSVLVRRASDGKVALDASVEIVLTIDAAESAHSDSAKPRRASRSLSANRLLHTAYLELPVHGSLDAEVRVLEGQQVGRLSFEVAVAPARSPLEQQWRSFALPPMALALFTIHQMLVHRRGALRRRKSS